MKAWIRAHARCCQLTFLRIIHAPFSYLLTLSVIAVTFCLPLAFYVLLCNFQSLIETRSPTPQISLFLSNDAQDNDVLALEQRLQKSEAIEKFHFVSRDQALSSIHGLSGFSSLSELVSVLGRNPLPHAFVVQAKSNSPKNLEQLKQEFQKWPKVSHVQVDSAWAQRIEDALSLGQYTVWTFSVLLAFMLISVSFNTIRLQILTHQAEIELTYLLGASHAYIRRPYLYYGTFLGLFGALLAWLMVATGLMAINQQLALLATHFNFHISLSHLSGQDSLSVCVFCAGFGWLGAWISVSRNIFALRLL